MLALALCPWAFALNPDLDINQYAHKTWTVRDGFFKGSIYAIAQMPDGYLWLGAEHTMAASEWRASAGRARSQLAGRSRREALDWN